MELMPILMLGLKMAILPGMQRYKEFLNGSIRPPIDRVGETGIMNNGLKATIIAYRKHIDMDVLF